MLKISHPDFGVEDIIEKCITSFKVNNTLKSKLETCKTKIIEEEKLYKELCEIKNFHTYPIQETIDSVLTVGEMSKIYNEKLVGGTAREYYDRIKLSVEDEKCPFCGQKEIKEIDHFLPKEKYSTLALTPLNLIPICKDCNFLKRNYIPSSYQEVLFNPYFDDFNSEEWLVARLSKSLPLRVKFLINTDISLSDDEIKRIGFTFERFQLGKTYRIEANSEINSMKFSWRNIFYSRGSEALQKRLEEDAESKKRHKNNSWQAALYDALSKSPWFYEDLIKDM